MSFWLSFSRETEHPLLLSLIYNLLWETSLSNPGAWEAVWHASARYNSRETRGIIQSELKGERKANDLSQKEENTRVQSQ